MPAVERYGLISLVFLTSVAGAAEPTRLRIARSPDGLMFTETGEVFMSRAGRPDLTRLPNGNLLAVFEWFEKGADAAPVLAVSQSGDEGTSWTRVRRVNLRLRDGRRVDGTHGTIVTTADGRVRLYFSHIGRHSADAGGQSAARTMIAGAVTRNGSDFVVDPDTAIRVEKPGEFAPQAVVVGKQVHLYVSSVSHDRTAVEESGVLCFVSDDGRRFRQSEPTGLTGVVAVADVMRLPHGYRMYAACAGGIGSLLSDDGTRWTSERGVRMTRATDLAVVPLKDKTFLLLSCCPGETNPGDPPPLAMAGAAGQGAGRLNRAEWAPFGGGSETDRGDAEVADATGAAPEADAAAVASELASRAGAGEDTPGTDLAPAYDPSGLFAPKPDFKNYIDYSKWHQDHVVTDIPDNAFFAYSSFMPGLTPKPSDAAWPESINDMFNGDYSGGIAPWNPSEHPEWDASYQQVAGLLDMFRGASRLPGYAQQLEFSRDATTADGEQMLFGLVLPSLSSHRRLTKATLAHAWRTEGGVVPSEQMLDAIETTLRGANHMEQGFTLIHHLVGISESQLVQTNALKALEHGVFTTPDELQRTLNVLQAYDVGAPSADRWVPGESAGAMQILQYMFTPAGPDGEPKLNLERAQSMASMLGIKTDDEAAAAIAKMGAKEARETADVIDTHWRGLREKWNTGYPLVKANDIDETAERLSLTNELTKIGIPSLSRAYHLTGRNEASRRATQLTYALHLFKARTGRWPATLDEMPPEYGTTARVDPFSGSHFGYRLTETGPCVYSSGENGRDDGGIHSKRWGDSTAPGESDDYVFWPPQE